MATAHDKRVKHLKDELSFILRRMCPKEKRRELLQACFSQSYTIRHEETEQKIIFMEFLK